MLLFDDHMMLVAGIKNFDEKLINTAINNGTDVNSAVNAFNYTPLLLSLLNGNIFAMKILIENGADPLIENGSGLCFIDYFSDDYAIVNKHKLKKYIAKNEIQKLLIKNVEKINIPRLLLLLKKNNIINKKIEKEYSYVFPGHELNLL